MYYHIIHFWPAIQVSTCESRPECPSISRLCWYEIDAPKYLYLKLQLIPYVREQILGPLLHVEQALKDLLRFWDTVPPVLSALLLLLSGLSDPALDDISKALRFSDFF